MDNKTLTIDDLYEIVFGFDNGVLSSEQKFSAIQKRDYELNDGEALRQLKEIKEREEIILSPEEELDFEDSIAFLNLKQ